MKKYREYLEELLEHQAEKRGLVILDEAMDSNRGFWIVKKKADGDEMNTLKSIFYEFTPVDVTVRERQEDICARIIKFGRDEEGILAEYLMLC